MRSLLLATMWVLLASAMVLAQAASLYVPQRVFVSATGQFGDFETMLADLGRADVVLIGEQHDHVNTHRVELSLLEGLASRRGEIALALEMFERDVQEPLGHFLMGHMEEEEFLAESRPWPQYARDYKPLVSLAIDRKWPVIAANVPRTLAAEVSQGGLTVLDGKTDAAKSLFARDIRCSASDNYFARFRRAMGTHAGAASGTDETTLRYFQAQCLKDETMAESIAQAYLAGATGGKRPLVLSINGAFHTDYGEGLTERTRRRLPDKRVVTVTIIPVESLDQVTPSDEARRRADYLVYTR